jgi:hypothetical protein
MRFPAEAPQAWRQRAQPKQIMGAGDVAPSDRVKPILSDKLQSAFAQHLA